MFRLEQTAEIVYCYPRMAKIINEMRLFLLAIALPAVFVVAGGIRLLWVGWCTSRTEALAAERPPPGFAPPSAPAHDAPAQRAAASVAQRPSG